MVRKVDTTIPPTTAIPMAIRWLQPSPVAKAKGINPKTVEALVIKIGRKRCRAASCTAVTLSSPFSCFKFANSTMRIPFLATNPINMMIPIWLNTFMVMSLKYMNINAPAIASGTVSMMMKGSLKLSNWAAKIK